MGRGLSPLQQQILRLAWEREQPAPRRTKAQQVLFPPRDLRARVWLEGHPEPLGTVAASQPRLPLCLAL